MPPSIDVVIPARAGSAGLPGKNRRQLIDRPLFMHSIACASLIDGVARVFVTTDDPDIADLATSEGAFVPELRPGELATSATPMVDVLRYAHRVLSDSAEGVADWILLLDPTSPTREPGQISLATAAVNDDDSISGFVSVSRPSFNPIWVGVLRDERGILARHSINPGGFTRRQDVPDYLRINGSFYQWRQEVVVDIESDWLDRGRYLAVEMDELASHSIDTLADFQLVEAIISHGLVTLPWMGQANGSK